MIMANTIDKNSIVEWSAGNIGALKFLMTVFANPETDMAQADIIYSKLMRCFGIRGTNAYVLYSDLCDRDINKVVQLCLNCPDAILEDACNRQDYSGRKLIMQYITENQ